MGECFFWYRPTRVVRDKRPLNGCVCVRVCVCVCVCVRVCVCGFHIQSLALVAEATKVSQLYVLLRPAPLFAVLVLTAAATADSIAVY